MPSIRCSYGVCKNDKRSSHKPHMKGVTFHKIPNPRYQLSKCELWVKACGREDFTVRDLSSRYKGNKLKQFYICSDHFVDPNGPSNENPDPVPNTKGVRMKNLRRCEISVGDTFVIPNDPNLNDNYETTIESEATITSDIEIETAILNAEISINQESEALGEKVLYVDNDGATIGNVTIIESQESQEMGEKLIYDDNDGGTIGNGTIIESQESQEVGEKSIYEDNNGVTIGNGTIIESQESQVLREEIPVLPNKELTLVEKLMGYSKNEIASAEFMLYQMNSDIINAESNNYEKQREYSDVRLNDGVGSLKELSNCIESPSGWLKNLLNSRLEFIQLDEEGTIVLTKLIVDENYNSSLFVLNTRLPDHHELMQKIPKFINTSSALAKSLNEINKWSVCCGNQDHHLKTEYSSKKRKSGYVCPITQAIRSSNCQKIFQTTSKGKRCKFCVSFRSQLRSSIFKRANKHPGNKVSKTIKYKKLKSEELIKILKETKKNEEALKRKLTMVEKKLKKYEDNFDSSSIDDLEEISQNDEETEDSCAEEFRKEIDSFEKDIHKEIESFIKGSSLTYSNRRITLT